MKVGCAIVIVVDGLRADALGSYGNARAQTPFLDQLAANSVLCDFAFSLDPVVDSFYASALLGVHPAYRHSGSVSLQPRNDISPLVNVASHYLVTDEATLGGELATSSVWTDIFTVSPAEAHSIHASRGSFASAAQWLADRFADRRSEPCVGWVHVSLPRLGGPIESRHDYDRVTTRLDEVVRRLFGELSFPDSSRVLRIVTAARGYALGERGQLGIEIPALHEELMHIPLIVHDQDLEPLRIQRLVSPLDLGAYVNDWLMHPGRAEPFTDRSSSRPAWLVKPADGAWPNYLFFANSSGDRGIRTPGWYLIREALSGGESTVTSAESVPPQLFLKPDDRWEFNEVSNLRPEIAELLAKNLDELERQACSGEPLNLGPLPVELLQGS